MRDIRGDIEKLIVTLSEEVDEFEKEIESCCDVSDAEDIDYYGGLVDSLEVIIGRLETILEGEE